jgi:hypothetical protein
MGGLADRIRYALANPLRDDHAIDPMRELDDLLREVSLEPESGGGAHPRRRSRGGRESTSSLDPNGQIVIEPCHAVHCLVKRGAPIRRGRSRGRMEIDPS